MAEQSLDLSSATPAEGDVPQWENTTRYIAAAFLVVALALCSRGSGTTMKCRTTTGQISPGVRVVMGMGASDARWGAPRKAGDAGV